MQMIATQSGRFLDPETTADGSPRARVAVTRLDTLWLNTGTLCNLSCENCYIESSPSNDRLSYLTRLEVAGYLAEIETESLPVREIGITGGEPFMNPDILGIMGDCLAAGCSVLVLTNAMRPMMKWADELLALNRDWCERLTIRVSVDHFDQSFHEQERGKRSWAPTIDGLKWLSDSGFRVHVAGRTRWGDDEVWLREGFQALFGEVGIRVDAQDAQQLILFPEMDETAEVPEITNECWNTLGVDPSSMMCASSRMVVKRRGAMAPEVVSCTLLPYQSEFSLGNSLRESLGEVALNHPHCARFCVLGGASCSG
jgi:uncharacterized Fe-S cluster-containing radical SAM superfamily protein